MNNITRQAVIFDHGKGAWVWDDKGNQYLDALCGVAVTGLGHAHPAVTKAISEQAQKLVHCSNLYQIKAQQLLSEKLCQLSGMKAAFFANSGAEANEAAIKIARLFGHQRKISTPTIITMDGSFHGRTLATLTATGSRKVQAGFEPLVSGFLRVPYNNLDAIRVIAKNNSQVVAILVEPLQGEGGIILPDADYLAELRDICDKHDWLLMLDEIQTGMGRSGQWFGFQHTAIKPDVMTLAKGMANGMPIGACLVNERANLFQPGNHGSTFGGNPVACQAALAVIDSIEKDGLLARVNHLSKILLDHFNDALNAHPQVQQIRGQGLLIGIEMKKPCGELVEKGLQAGILVNVTAGNVVRLLPPFILSDDEAEQLAQRVIDLINQFQ